MSHPDNQNPTSPDSQNVETSPIPEKPSKPEWFEPCRVLLAEHREQNQSTRRVKVWNVTKDILSILFIPLAIFIATWWNDKQSSDREERLSQDRNHQAILASYLDRIKDLEAGDQYQKDDKEKKFTRAMTLPILRELDKDPDRKARLILFLYEADYITGRNCVHEDVGVNAIKQQPLILKTANLRNVNFEGFNLKEIGLQGADLRDATLTNANLSNAIFCYANLTKADLTKADLTKADLTKADLTNAKFTDAKFTDAKFTDANLTDADLTNATLEGAYLKGVKGLTQQQVDEKWYLVWQILHPDSEIDLTKDLKEKDLSNANLTDANLTKANLTNAKLTKANLTDANLTNANLTKANLTDADLTKANLSKANLTNANLTGAKITDEQLESAATLCKTTMPSGDLSSRDCPNEE